MGTIKWKLNDQDRSLIEAIAQKAMTEYGFDFINTSMDLTACHNNGCQLKLEELLNADEFDFLHDLYGIKLNIDHSTGKLTNCFLPRFAK